MYPLIVWSTQGLSVILCQFGRKCCSLAPTGRCASRLAIVKSKHTPMLGRIQAGKVHRMSRTSFVELFDSSVGWEELARERAVCALGGCLGDTGCDCRVDLALSMHL